MPQFTKYIFFLSKARDGLHAVPCYQTHCTVHCISYPWKGKKNQIQTRILLLTAKTIYKCTVRYMLSPSALHGKETWDSPYYSFLRQGEDCTVRKKHYMRLCANSTCTGFLTGKKWCDCQRHISSFGRASFTGLLQSLSNSRAARLCFLLYCMW